MRAARYFAIALVAGLVATAPRVETAPFQSPTPLYQRFLSNPNPLELVAAKKVDRVAWTVYDEGPPHELSGGRRDRHLPDPDFGRRVGGGVLPRHGSEPRRVGGQRLRGSGRRRAGDLGGEDQGRTRLACRRRDVDR